MMRQLDKTTFTGARVPLRVDDGVTVAHPDPMEGSRPVCKIEQASLVMV